MTTLLRLRDVERTLAVSRSTLKRLIIDGKLPAVKLPSGHHRVDEFELAKFIRRQRTESHD